MPELARRWRVTEQTAEAFLEGFEAQGLAVRRGRLWSATVGDEVAVALLAVDRLVDRRG